MSLISKKVTRKLLEYKEICNLMKNAFPKSELFPLWMLRLFSLRKNTKFLALYDNEDFCGILYTVENEKYIFVLYLAVNDKIRSKGYGTKILEWLKNQTSKKIVLDVEEKNPNAENALQREKRIEFYKKNGITDTGYRFFDTDETYVVLFSGESFEIKEFEKLLKYFSFGLYKVKFYKV